MFDKIKMLLEIFLAFFKISPLTFGGGYAIIPFLEKEMVEKKKWIKEEDIADVFAISGSIPGAIAVNSAMFTGYRLMGVPGAVVAMMGILLPSLVIILILSTAYLRCGDNIYIKAAFRGIKPAIAGLIFAAAVRIGKVSIIDRPTLIVGAATLLVLIVFSRINPIHMILLGLITGIALCKAKDWLTYKKALGNPEDIEKND